MNAVSHIFFRQRATFPESTGEVIEWWESRRPVFNIAVGTTGLVTLGIMNVMFAMPPSPEPMPWQVSVLGAVLYGTAANVCYSAGWVAELFLRRWIRQDTAAAGAAIFRYGFAFSIGLTLVPAGVATLAWLARTIAAIT